MNKRVKYNKVNWNGCQGIEVEAGGKKILVKNSKRGE
jgi:hypothetical protein